MRAPAANQALFCAVKSFSMMSSPSTLCSTLHSVGDSLDVARIAALTLMKLTAIQIHTFAAEHVWNECQQSQYWHGLWYLSVVYLIGKRFHEREHTWLLFLGLPDHDADPQIHEGGGEIHHSLSDWRDCQVTNSHISSLQPFSGVPQLLVTPHLHINCWPCPSYTSTASHAPTYSHCWLQLWNERRSTYQFCITEWRWTPMNSEKGVGEHQTPEVSCCQCFVLYPYNLFLLR